MKGLAMHSKNELALVIVPYDLQINQSDGLVTSE